MQIRNCVRLSTWSYPPIHLHPGWMGFMSKISSAVVNQANSVGKQQDIKLESKSKTRGGDNLVAWEPTGKVSTHLTPGITFAHNRDVGDHFSNLRRDAHFAFQLLGHGNKAQKTICERQTPMDHQGSSSMWLKATQVNHSF